LFSACLNAWPMSLLALSIVAAIAGLVLLLTQPESAATKAGGRLCATAKAEEGQVTHEHLLRMIFIYWVVYGVAVLTQKVISPELTALLVPLKLTALLTYFLTFSSLLCLPLNYIEARRQAQ
jgi:hypothetical protein